MYDVELIPKGFTLHDVGAFYLVGVSFALVEDGVIKIGVGDDTLYYTMSDFHRIKVQPHANTKAL